MEHDEEQQDQEPAQPTANKAVKWGKCVETENWAGFWGAEEDKKYGAGEVDPEVR